MSKRPLVRRVKWLNSTVLGIGLASLFPDVGHEWPRLLSWILAGHLARVGNAVRDCDVINRSGDYRKHKLGYAAK